MAEVFVTAKGNITAASKRALREAGVIVVEVDDLAKCEFVRASEVLSGDDMFFAALRALNTAEGFEGRKQRDVFVKTLLELTEAARQKAEPSA